MAHLSTPEHPFGKPFTNKRYIHPPLAENIVTMWPNSMVMIGEIPPENPQVNYEHPKYGWFWGLCSEDSAAVVFTLKKLEDPHFRQRNWKIYQNYTLAHELMPAHATKYHTRKDGIPIHSFKKDMDAVTFHEEAFCDAERVPTAYIKVTVENNFGFEEEITLGALVRRGAEFHFTGTQEPDGYHGYHPSRERFLESEKLTVQDGCLTDGKYKFYFDKAEDFVFDTENDIGITLRLQPYEKRTFTFAFTRSENPPKRYGQARRACIAFWKRELGKAKNIPDTNGIEPLFYSLLSQMLQMFAHPHDRDYTIMRQGGTQRYHWPEAVEMIRALSMIGGYADYMDAGLAHYFGELQEKSGEDAGKIFYPHVTWNTRTAVSLSMLAAAVKDEPTLFEKYIDSAMLAFRYCERERASSASMDGALAGLLPPGRCTDTPIAKGQQWTFADTNVLRAYADFAEMLQEKQSPHADEVHAAYLDYLSVMQGIFNKYAEEQKDSEYLYLPRDPKNIPELEAELAKDFFGYMLPNELLSVGGAGYGTPEAEKLIFTYSHGGQSSHGLIQPCYRSTSGTGRTWYTAWSELKRFEYYEKCGNRAEQKKLIDALLAYNVTSEFYQAERIDDHDAYIAPWMPNASANGRLLQMLFIYHGAKACAKTKA